MESKQFVTEKLVSKKLGVVGVAIGSLVWLADKPADLAKLICWQITFIVFAYIVIQGVLDWSKK